MNPFLQDIQTLFPLIPVPLLSTKGTNQSLLSVWCVWRGVCVCNINGIIQSALSYLSYSLSSISGHCIRGH